MTEKNKTVDSLEGLFKKLNKTITEVVDGTNLSDMFDFTNEFNKEDLPVYKFALREDLENKCEFLPQRAYDTDTGWDACAAMSDHKDLTLRYGDTVIVPLGFRVLCPEGWWLKVVPRSSSFAKKHLHFLYGVVDEGFEGNVGAVFQYLPPTKGITNDELVIKFGEKICQLIPVRRQEMIVEKTSNKEYDELCAKRGGKREAGGFGSTDQKGK